MAVGIYKQSARDIMTTRVETLRERDTVHYALLMMAENDISAVPVLSADGRCIGMIAQRDIIAEAREKDIEDGERTEYAAPYFGSVALDELTNERVEDMMSEKLVTVSPKDSVTDVADRMLDNSVHHIPVVDQDNRLVGIISTMDILAALRSPID